MLKNALPLCLNLDFFRILIIGAGEVAWQKLKTLIEFKCRIKVVAPRACEPIKKLAKEQRISLSLRGFRDADVHGCHLIYACSDVPSLNKRIAKLAKQRKALVNIVDSPGLSNFISPAVYSSRDWLIAVSTRGRNPRLAARMRDKIKKIIQGKCKVKENSR